MVSMSILERGWIGIMVSIVYESWKNMDRDCDDYSVHILNQNMDRYWGEYKYHGFKMDQNCGEYKYPGSKMDRDCGEYKCYGL